MEKFPELKFASLFENEEAVLKYWQDNHIFEQSLEQTKGKEPFSFYDGPPFITGMPHYGTLLPSIAKDIIPRYQTMRGKYVRRVWGWDCHGLPAENQVEKQLGLKNKKDVEAYGIDKYIEACKDYVRVGSEQWKWYVDHIGRWVDMEHAYRTDKLDFMETTMWLFKQLYDKGYTYKGNRVSLYCPRCATPLSKFEVTMDEGSYKDVEDPAVVVAFKLKDSDRYLLAWTTTPWTLPANLGLAVNEQAEYVEVERDGKTLIIAKDRIEEIGGEAKSTFKGSELVGQSYEPLFDYFTKLSNDKDYHIHHADFVSMTDGTGVVHIAPSFGEDDYALGQKAGLSMVETLDDNGVFLPNIEVCAGNYYKKANTQIMENLRERGLVIKESTVTHSYPHCHRCATPLIYKTQDSWFLKLDHNNLRARMLEGNKSINWVPDYLGEKRFVYNIENAPDWSLSRSRYFGTPIPVWESENGDRIVVGSIEELEKLSGQIITDLHKPLIDEVKITKAGIVYTRIKEVLDGWFESGAMPYGQFHYPFENEQEMLDSYPTDYIVEYTGQLRGWFYVLHVLSHALFDDKEPKYANSYQNVVVTGVLSGNDGRKMSKSLGNYPDPKLVMEKYGAEALRLYFAESRTMAGEDMAIDELAIRDESRLLNILWNSYRYFATYANLHNFEPTGKVSEQIMDKWIVSRLHSFIRDYSENLDKFDFVGSNRHIRPFIEDLSTWYIRRGRDRFVAGDADALETLYSVLRDFSLASAPTLAFSSESIYRALTGESSVHLASYPEYHTSVIMSDLETKMAKVREVASLVHKLRAEKGHSLRQKLSDVVLVKLSDILEDEAISGVLKEEINVTKLLGEEGEGEYVYVEEGGLKVGLNVTITDELREDGLVRELIRGLQDARKQAGLKVGESASAEFKTDVRELFGLIDKNKDYIIKTVNLNELVEGEAENGIEMLDGNLKIKVK